MLIKQSGWGVVVGISLAVAACGDNYIPEVVLDPGSVSMAVGQSRSVDVVETGYQMGLATMAWTTDNAAVATVKFSDEDGVLAVYGKSVGHTKAHAMYASSEVSVDVVVKPVTSADDDPTDPGPHGPSPDAVLRSLRTVVPEKDVALWQIEQLQAIATYSDGTEVDVTDDATWSAVTPQIASVDDSVADGDRGETVARAQGDAWFQASFGGLTADAELVVEHDACHVVINEVKTGTLLLQKDEFVEIFNPCNEWFDLSRAQLVYESPLNLIHLPAGNLSGILDPGEYQVFAGASFTGLTDGALLIDLSQVGGAIGLSDRDTSAVSDSMAWGTSLGDLVEGVVAALVPSGQSMSRSATGHDTNVNSVDFHAAAATPGAPNR